MLYLEWDGFVGVLECWGNVLKSDPDLRSVLVWKCMYMCITRTCHVYAHATCTCTYVVYHVMKCISKCMYMCMTNTY